MLTQATKAGRGAITKVGWQDFGSTAADGNVARELLAGAYTFEMTYNNGRQTYSGHPVPASPAAQVLFETTEVPITYPGSVTYHQVAWANFAQPQMNLLPGTYTFKLGTTVLSGIQVAGCTMSGDLTVEFPGISSVHTYVRKSDGVAGTASGSLVAQMTYKNDQAVFTGLPNSIYDIVVVKGAKTLILDDVVVFGATTVDEIVATLTVNFPGISSVHSYAYVDDGAEDSVSGGLVEQSTYKTGSTTMTVLRGLYDVKVVKGGMNYFADGIDWSSPTCSVGNITSTMTVTVPRYKQRAQLCQS